MSLIKQSFQAVIINQNINMYVHPENTKRSPYVGLMLRQYRKRCTNFISPSGQLLLDVLDIDS